MSKPKMILFDYGHTLLYEKGYNTLNGEEALLPYITSNPKKYSPEQINAFFESIFGQLHSVRYGGYEIHERQLQRFVYEYLEIEFSISFEEIEELFWYGTSPGDIMPGADKMLSYLKVNGIRTGVISNISYSGQALKNRLDRLLPENNFEFVIASSEYIFRKPSKYIFEIALKKAGLQGKDVWYCGDNPEADVEGASNAGIFPVWYDNSIDCFYRKKAEEKVPVCKHLHIHEWDELIEMLENDEP